MEGDFWKALDFVAHVELGGKILDAEEGAVLGNAYLVGGKLVPFLQKKNQLTLQSIGRNYATYCNASANHKTN
jgi:hypothetical protein